MALILAALAVIYVLANVFVARKTSTGQAAVEQYHNNVYGRVGDVLGNVTVVQSYARFASEMQAMRTIMARAAGGAISGADLVGPADRADAHRPPPSRWSPSMPSAPCWSRAGRSRSARSWPSSASPAC